MKKIALLFIALSSVLISCNSEEIIKETHASTGVNSTFNNPIPTNPANPFDAAGKAHTDILDAYLLSDNVNDTTITKISQRVNEIALTNMDLMTLNTGYTTTMINPEDIQKILKDPVVELNTVITKSALSPEAKTSLLNFTDSLRLLEDEHYEVIYQFIISYETSVLNDTEFSIFDKRVLLLTSSIARHSSFYFRKRTDKDWSKSTGNLVGVVKGAIESPYTAVTSSLVSSIAQNKNVISR